MVKGNVEEVVSGLGVEEKKLIWRIDNFAVVERHDKLIQAQSFEFQAGDSIGLSSKWQVNLCCNQRKPSWIGISLKLIEKPKTKQDYLIAECSFKTYKIIGISLVNEKKGTMDWYAPHMTGWCCPTFIGKNEDVPLENGSLVINCKFRLYANTQSLEKMSMDVDEMLEKFHLSSKAKAGRDLAHLIYPVSCSEIGIEICSSEGKQFKARKEVLAARSPVFEAMFRSEEMKDKAEEKLKLELTDVSSQTMEVFLHYLCTGELLPNWRQREVILELTNAAAKYELQDLLGFLDTVVGKVCDGENALPLINLAGKLDLNNSEKKLMGFVQGKGLATKKNSSCYIV